VTATAPAPPGSTVPEVLAQLQAVAAGLPRGDGLACFVRLYVEVTDGVNAALDRSTFANSAFLERLDVVFAGLFLRTLEASAKAPGSVPRAWAPLFEARSGRGIAPLQFALAGMNAHINRDLPVALVATCRELGVELRPDGAEHADFERVNALLGQVESRVKQEYLTGWLKTVDRLVHRVDRLEDVVAMWDVERAREAAWTNSEALWALRASPELSARFLLTLDRTVGLAGRGLLIPAESWLGRLFGRL
jgi:hypothetical protein